MCQHTSLPFFLSSSLSQRNRKRMRCHCLPLHLERLGRHLSQHLLQWQIHRRGVVVGVMHNDLAIAGDCAFDITTDLTRCSRFTHVPLPRTAITVPQKGVGNKGQATHIIFWSLFGDILFSFRSLFGNLFSFLLTILPILFRLPPLAAQ